MKKTYTIIAALALAAAAYSQDGGNGLPPRLSSQADNLFQPSDCDEDGWLWFDTQDKIDRYVGAANNEDGAWQVGGKLVQLGTTNYSPYDECYALPDFEGVGTDGTIGSDGARTGGIAIQPSSANMTFNGGCVMFYLPTCKKFDMVLASESSIKVRLKANTTPDDAGLAYTDYRVVNAKYATVFGKLSGPGMKEWYDLQNLINGSDDLKFDTRQPMVALLENCASDTLYLQAVRIYTYEPSTLGIDEVAAPGLGINISRRAVTLTEPRDISVCTLAGAVVASAKAARTLSLASLPAGAYIVRAGDKSRKVVIR